MHKDFIRFGFGSLGSFILLAAALIVTLPAHAADIAFTDGTVWKDVRILSYEPTSLIVLREHAVETVHAEQLLPDSRIALHLRVPTEAELAAEKDAIERARAAAVPVRTAALPVQQVNSDANSVSDERGSSANPTDEPEVVRELSTIVPTDPWGYVTEIWIDGRLLARAGKAAIAQGDGPPASQSRHGRIGWIEGPVYLHADSRLAMTYRDFPIRGRLVPAGEHRYRDSAGVVHVLDAYRLY